MGHFAGVLVIIVLSTIKERTKFSENKYDVVIWNLFGVFLHELCHLIFGLLFLKKPASFSIFPDVSSSFDINENKEVERYWKLGSVSFYDIGFLSAFPIAVAPLFLVPISYWLYKYYFLYVSETFLNTIYLYIFVYFLVYNAIPSIVDIKLMFYRGSIFFYLILISFLYALWGDTDVVKQIIRIYS